MSSGFKAKETLELMLGHLGLVFEIQEENRPMGPTLHVLTQEPDRLIGPEGKVLEDLQYLLNRVLSSGEEKEDTMRVIVDVENYRKNQYQVLLDEVEKTVQKVRETGEKAELPPMNSFERRLVHNAYKDDAEIKTTSPDERSRLKKIIITKIG